MLNPPMMRCDVAYRPFHWSRWIISRQSEERNPNQPRQRQTEGRGLGVGSSAKENRDEGSVDQHRGDLPDPGNFPRFEPISSHSLCSRDTLAGGWPELFDLELPLSSPRDPRPTLPCFLFLARLAG